MDSTSTDISNTTTPSSAETPTATDMTSGENGRPTLAGRFIRRLAAWRERYVPEFPFIIFMAALVGVAAGVAALAFRKSIASMSAFFTDKVVDGHINWWLIFLPVIGIMLTGIFTRYIIRKDITHGIDRLKQNLSQKNYNLAHRIIYSPFIGGLLTLGFGGTSGSEGPIAYVGAGIGSNIGQALRLSPKGVKILLGCGTSAAIAGIFMSPVGGVMFALEYLKMEFSTLPVIAVTVACLVAYAFLFITTGEVFGNSYTPPMHDFDNAQFLAVIILGIVCGLYSMYYSYCVNKTDVLFKRIKNPWMSNLTGGVIMGICLVLFPSLYGVGYPVDSQIIHGNYLSISDGCVLPVKDLGKWAIMIAAVCVLALKGWGVGATNSSGGIGGDFSPVLFAGAVCGFLFASFSNTVFGTHLPEGLYALIGMAGVMSGAIGAPLMTIFLTIDLAQTTTLAAPASVCAVIAYITVRLAPSVFKLDLELFQHVRSRI